MYIVSYKTEDWSEDYEPLGQLKLFVGEKEAFNFVFSLIRNALSLDTSSKEEATLKRVTDLMSKCEYNYAAQELIDLHQISCSRKERENILFSLKEEEENFHECSLFNRSLMKVIRDFNSLNIEECTDIIVTYAHGPGENE